MVRRPPPLLSPSTVFLQVSSSFSCLVFHALILYLLYPLTYLFRSIFFFSSTVIDICLLSVGGGVLSTPPSCCSLGGAISTTAAMFASPTVGLNDGQYLASICCLFIRDRIIPHNINYTQQFTCPLLITPGGTRMESSRSILKRVRSVATYKRWRAARRSSAASISTSTFSSRRPRVPLDSPHSHPTASVCAAPCTPDNA